MAVQAWTDVNIFIDDIEVAAYGKSFSLNITSTELDTTPLSTTGWRTRIGGLKTASFGMELMSDVAVDTLDDALYPLIGAANTVKTIAVGSASGSPAYLTRGVVFDYTPWSGQVGELAMGSLTAQTSGVLARGRLLHPNTSRNSSSTGTGYQLGAVASGKSLYAALHVTEITGSPTLDVIVQSDDNAGFTTPTSRITFSQATGRSSQWGSVAGSVTDDNWRISYTFGGTGSIAFAVSAGIY